MINNEFSKISNQNIACSILANDEIFTSDELMKENVIPMPYITKVTYLAKKKKVKLSYHKDVRDIIKDIYKHV